MPALSEVKTSSVAPTASAAPRQLSEIALIGVYEISKILTAPARLETTLSNVLKLLSSFLDMQNGTIVLLDASGAPEIVVGASLTRQAGDSRGSPPQKAIDQIVATAMPLVIQNVLGHPLFEGAEPDVCRPATRLAFIGVPIRLGAKVLGTLTIDRTSDSQSFMRFDHDVRFLSMVANLIAQTIQLHRVIAKDRERLMEESRRLEKQLETDKPVSARRIRASGIIGESRPIRALLDKISIVAKSNATVLLRGESGTGKELFARAIHEQSARASGPFIKVNCAALPETVLESELFGHEKGAFTGALTARKGRFEMADGGTLFLDEIGEISPSFQAKLLRVLQEGEFDRVGSSRTQKVNVRIVAATNKNLEEAVASGEFRADLYYRISVVPLVLPALRDRKGDIPLLAQSFLERFNKENKRELTLSQSAVDVLRSCYFPGNVRELENCVCRTATLAQNESIVAHDFACDHGECLSATLWKTRGAPPVKALGGFTPLPIATNRQSAPAAPSAPPPATRPAVPVTPDDVPDEDFSADAASLGANDDTAVRVSREALVEAMERCGWVQAKAARLLKLTPRQIGYALRKYNIDIKRL